MTMQNFFKKIFLEHFEVYSKIEGKVHRFSIYSLYLYVHKHITSSIINVSHRATSTFVTIDEPTLTYHYHSKPIVHIDVHSQCCTYIHSMDLDKCIATYTHHSIR